MALSVYNAGEEPPHGPTVRGGTRRTEHRDGGGRKEANVPCGDQEEIMRLPIPPPSSRGKMSGTRSDLRRANVRRPPPSA